MHHGANESGQPCPVPPQAFPLLAVSCRGSAAGSLEAANEHIRILLDDCARRWGCTAAPRWPRQRACPSQPPALLAAEASPRFSADAVGVFDCVSRGSMLGALLSQPELRPVLPYAAALRAPRSAHTRGTTMMVVCMTVVKGRRGKQGDPPHSMHWPSTPRSLTSRHSEPACRSLHRRSTRAHSHTLRCRSPERIRLHQDKTRIWNSSPTLAREKERKLSGRGPTRTVLRFFLGSDAFCAASPVQIARTMATGSCDISPTSTTTCGRRGSCCSPDHSIPSTTCLAPASQAWLKWAAKHNLAHRVFSHISLSRPEHPLSQEEQTQPWQTLAQVSPFA